MESFVKPKRTAASRIINHVLKLAATVFFALWMLVPGAVGWFQGKVDVGIFESFIFGVDEIIGPTATMIALARMLIALAVPIGLYRDDVSDFLGLELYGPRLVARILFFVGAMMYLIAAFIHWTYLTGGF